MKAELEAARTMEMAKIEQQKAKEREEELAYKEYCEVISLYFALKLLYDLVCRLELPNDYRP